jgi:hypothetical protein
MRRPGRTARRRLADPRRCQAGIIPGARLRFLDGVAHVPHLEGDPATLDEIAAFVDALAQDRG